MSEKRLNEEARLAIVKLFSDTSVSPIQTRERLEELIGEIEEMIETLPDE